MLCVQALKTFGTDFTLISRVFCGADAAADQEQVHEGEQGAEFDMSRLYDGVHVMSCVYMPVLAQLQALPLPQTVVLHRRLLQRICTGCR